MRRTVARALWLLLLLPPGRAVTTEEEEVDDQPSEAVFTSQPRQEVVNEGREIRLPCFLEWMDEFVLVWKFASSVSTAASDTILSVDQKVIEKEDQARVRVEKEKKGNWLVVKGARAEDEGRYTCMVSALNPKWLSHRVMVRSQPEVAVEGGEVVTVVEGGNVTARCRVLRGHPQPELTWRDPAGSLVGRPGGVLALTAVTRAQAGRYSCRGDNGFGGEGVVAGLGVVVEHGPKLGSDEVLHSTGGPISLECRVEAVPAAEVRWSREGEELEVEGEGPLHRLAVTLEQDEAGRVEDVTYTCAAANRHGTASKTFLVTSRPSQPLVTFSPSRAQVTLRWQVASSLEVSTFRLEVEGPDGFQLNKTLTAVPGGNSSDLTEGRFVLELVADGQYRARVAATNSQGEGPASGWLVFRPATASATPPRLPRLLHGLLLALLPSVGLALCNVL
jgi:hypothetical protein